jgi:hypothetical protein
MLLALVVLVTACAEIQVAGSPNDCTSLENRLRELGVDPSDVADVETQVERASGEGGVLRRWAWAKMKSCDGYVVVRTDTGCGRRGSDPYTTGTCRLPEPRAA